MVKRITLIFAVIALASATVIVGGSRLGPSAVAAGRFRTHVVNVASDSAPAPTPTGLATDRVVLAMISLKVEEGSAQGKETFSLSTVKRGIKPAILGQSVVTTGDVTVKDTYAGFCSTAELRFGEDTLQMTLETVPDGDPRIVRVKFNGSKTWIHAIVCPGGNTAEWSHTFTDLLGIAMNRYRSEYGGYAFDVPLADANERCLTRYGHYEGEDVVFSRTVKVTLDLYVHRGDCTFLIPVY